MAEKKIFTSLAFQSGANLIAPKIETVSPASKLVSGNESFYDGGAGQLAYANGDLYVSNDTDWFKLLRKTTDTTISGHFTFNRTDNSSNGITPFSIGSESSHKLVAGLQAETLGTNSADLADGTHGISDTATEHGIPVYGASGVLPVGTPTADGHAANKGYVDTVAQGLSIKTAVRCATTEDIIISSALNAGDSIDGVTLANGDRVLVKDLGSDYQKNNGIYIVGSSPARATDYDAAAEINDGDFFFVQEGNTNGNKGFVQTKNITTLGTDKIIFEQFSEAGNLEVYSQAGTGTPSKTAGPLVQVGNDVTFKYNATRFKLTSNALDVEDGGIQTDQLGADSVTPLKLDDSASFTMGGLTIDTSNPSIILDKTETGWGSLRFYKAGSQVSYIQLDGSEEMIYYQPSSLGHLFYAGGSPALKVNHNGSIGIGADATSPSGTLHISTARYGSNLVTNGTLDGWDDSNNPTNWGIYTSGTSTVTSDTSTKYEGSASAKLTVDSSNSNVYIRTDAEIMTAGRAYKVCFYAKASSAINDIAVYAIGQNTSFYTPALTTDWAKYETTYTPTVTSALLIGRLAGANAAGKSFWIDKVEVYEDSLASTPSTTADDLVINNGLSQAGLTILGSGGARIHFGESGHAAQSAIVNTYGTDKHSTLSFQVCNAGGTAATALSLDGDNNSAKFEGGLGVGTAESTAGTITAKADGGRIKLESNDFIIAALSRQGTSGSSLDQGSLALYNAGVGKIELLSNGTSVFSGGSVAIKGGAGGGTDLSLGGTGLPSHGTLVFNNGGGAAIGKIRVEGNDDSFYVSKLAGGGKFYFTSDGEDFVFSGADQDHGGKQIVNSATVAGLQDGGACYDFDGTDDSVSFTTPAPFSGNGLNSFDATLSAWAKFNSIGQFEAIVCLGTFDFEIAPLNSNNNEVGIYINDAAWTGDNFTPTVGEWNHYVATKDGDTYSLYVDGVLIGTATDADNGTVGTTSYVGRNGSSSYFDGQIRDVKIFPSALEAGDIRKLYSGENPKKNTNTTPAAFSALNGEDWSGASGGTPPTGWTEGAAGTFSVSAGELSIIKNANHSYIYKNFTVAAGEVYKISFRVKNVNASYIRVSIGSSDRGEEFGNTDHSSTSYTTYEKIVTATSTMISLYVQINTATADQSGVIDFLRVNEVETLVDFNPQSASSSKWRNEALLGFYDGTVNNATLSQGNSYWNNIKQDGDKVLLLPKAASNGSITTARLGIGIDDPAVVSAPITLRAKQNTPFLEVKDDINADKSRVSFEYNYSGTDRLDINIHHPSKSTVMSLYEGDDVKVHGKLGVGTAADASHHLLVGGTARIEYAGGAASGLAIVGSSNRSKIAIVDNDTTAYVIAENDYISVGGSDSLNASNLNIHKTSGNVAIGSISPQVLFEARKPEASHSDGWYGSFNSDFDTGDWLGLHIGYGQTTSQNYRKTGVAFERTDGSYARGKLHIINDGAADNAAAVLGDSVHSWDYDGTQDHKGNRIVNSQTLNDSWRTSEPSLRFDASNDYVALPTASYDAVKGSQITVSAWIKRETDTNVYDGIVATSVNLADGFALLIGGGTTAGTTDKLFWQFDGSAGQIDSESGGVTIPLGEWTHVVGTYDGTTLKTYVNGVADRTSTSAGKSLDGSNKTIYIGAQGVGSGAFSGEIKDVRIHNRALEAAEIKGYYNGESAPFHSTNAGGHVLTGSASTFGSSLGYWTLEGGYGTLSAGSGVMTFGDTSGTSTRGPRQLQYTLENGRLYRIRFKCRLATGTAQNITAKAFNGSSKWKKWALGETGHLDSYTFSFTPTGGSGTLTQYETDVFIVDDSSASYTGCLFFSMSGSSNNATYEFDDVEIIRAGEVAAYTPQSINDKWYDTTSNANHGTITGATKVGDNRYQGIFEVRGITELNPTGSSNSKHSPDSGTIHLGRTPDYRGRIDYDAGSATNFSIDNTYNNASAKTSFGMNSASTRLPVLELLGSGEVKATSATSTNLIQVARVHSETITTDATNKFYRIHHNLGTRKVCVQASQYNASYDYRSVEIAHRAGDWVGAAAGNTLAASNMGANNSAKATSTLNYVTLEFAAAPGAVDLDVTVIG